MSASRLAIVGAAQQGKPVWWYAHCDVVRIYVVALQPDRVASGVARAEHSRVICAEDERIARGIGEVLREGGCLVDVVPV